jgi:hypothetical protein
LITFLATADLEEQISSLALRTVGVSSVALIILVLIAVAVKRAPEKFQKYFKLPLFIGIAGVMAGSTLLLSGSTVYLNVKSESGGPVHWHAGIEFWTCGSEVNLRDPNGALSNKVGSATYHEHNDKYIHLEGVVVKKSVDASLDKFMNVTGGYITDGSIGIPLSDDMAAWPVTGDQFDGDDDAGQVMQVATSERVGQTADGPVLELENGDLCPDGQPGEVQVFKYTYNKDDDTYSQEKLSDPGSYIMRDESTLGPPSDCIIVEFAPSKAATDKLCEQYGIKDFDKCEAYGVSEHNPDLCAIREVSRPSDTKSDDATTDEQFLPSQNDENGEPATSAACLYEPDNPDQVCNDTPSSPVQPVPTNEGDSQ